MSCAVCICTHHAAIHDTSGEGIGACQYRGGCECKEYKDLDQAAWAKKRKLSLECGTEAEELSREEGREMFDRASRDALGISGTEFLGRWDAGGFDDTGDPAVTRVAMLIPFAR